MDPYVEVRIRGHQEDYALPANKQETEPVRNNGFSPTWSQKFEFYLTAPEVAFLDLKVRTAEITEDNALSFRLKITATATRTSISAPSPPVSRTFKKVKQKTLFLSNKQLVARLQESLPCRLCWERAKTGLLVPQD